jgi:hypothetical protein
MRFKEGSSARATASEASSVPPALQPALPAHPGPARSGQRSVWGGVASCPGSTAERSSVLVTQGELGHVEVPDCQPQRGGRRWLPGTFGRTCAWEPQGSGRLGPARRLGPVTRPSRLGRLIGERSRRFPNRIGSVPGLAFGPRAGQPPSAPWLAETVRTVRPRCCSH